jgi:hypothetical protein
MGWYHSSFSVALFSYKFVVRLLELVILVEAPLGCMLTSCSFLGLLCGRFKGVYLFALTLLVHGYNLTLLWMIEDTSEALLDSEVIFLLERVHPYGFCM